MAAKHLISILDLSREQILQLLHRALQMKQAPPPLVARGRLLASCFFEPSTRTRLCFEAAMHRLGGAVIGFAEGGHSSASKGESLADAMRIIGSYADLIVLRHPNDGAALLASQATHTPLINAGDGTNQHPSQTLIDLFTIQESQKRLDGLTICIVGDLKHGRAVHSLVLGLTHFKVQLQCIAPSQLALPDSLRQLLQARSIPFSMQDSIAEGIDRADVIYMTRLQRERLVGDVQESIMEGCLLRLEHLKRVKPNLKILHPLPRVHEIDQRIDDTPYAYYFPQAANGICVRQALIEWMLHDHN